MRSHPYPLLPIQVNAWVGIFLFTAVFTYLNHICRRGTAPVKLFYVPKDCRCRAPTAWPIYLKIAVM